MKQNTTAPFFGGIPTKIDVDRLMELIAKFKEGDLVPYPDIESSIGEKRTTHRFRSVVTAWRKRLMKEKNFLLIAITNEGYKIALPDERMTFSAAQAFQGRKKIMRGSAVAAATDETRLSPEHKKLREHLQTLPARLRLAELTAPKPLTA